MIKITISHTKPAKRAKCGVEDVALGSFNETITEGFEKAPGTALLE